MSATVIKLGKLDPLITDSPFSGDLLERKPIADKLTRYITTLEKGHTLAIDGGWGSGKTWFGLHWKSQLEQDGYKTIWLDAFACDYAEDPFVPLMEKIVQLAKKEKHSNTDGIINSAVNISKKLLPAVGKAVVAAAIKRTVGEEGKGDIEAALENADELTEKILYEQIKKSEDNAASIKALKEKLTEFAKLTLDKPLVFFIDELDRCKPDFAVKLIERVKHFLETENVVFVLLLNRAQINAAIKGLYGEHFDAHDYLDKFIHATLALPKFNTASARSEESAYRFAKNSAKRLGIPETIQLDNFCHALPLTVSAFGMSLRHIERALILYHLSEADWLEWLAAWLISLKIKDPTTFNLCKENKIEGHTRALSYLNAAVGSKASRARESITLIHKAAQPMTALSQEETRKLISLTNSLSIREQEILATMIKDIDLPDIE